MAKRTKKISKKRPPSDPNVAAYEAVRKLTGEPSRPKKPAKRKRAKSRE